MSNDLFGGLIDQPAPKRQEPPAADRASSNGRTSGFEPVNTGSTPVARSMPPALPVEKRTKAPVPRDPRMMRNEGRCPKAAHGKRVVVELANGQTHGVEPTTSTSQPGWDADGQGKCRWTLTDSPFDIAYYRVL